MTFPYVVSSAALGKAGATAGSERITVGCIGVGPQGTGVMRGFLGQKDAQVVAVCDVKSNVLQNRQELVNKHYNGTGCKAYKDFRELLDEQKPQISVDYKKGATIITFMNEKILDDYDIQSLADSIFGLLDEAPSSAAEPRQINLILNFHPVEYMSSTVLGLLIRISKKVHEHGGQIRLCNISTRIYKAFEITGLNKIFDIFQDVDDALKDATAGRP